MVQLLANHHYLLCTLVLWNAAAMEALPIFLDRLADPVTAICLSVTVVLIFGARCHCPVPGSPLSSRKPDFIAPECFTTLSKCF